MGPSLSFGEARKEATGCDTAGRHATDILHIGKQGLELFLVVIPKWQAPTPVYGLLASFNQLVSKIIVLTHNG